MLSSQLTCLVRLLNLEREELASCGSPLLGFSGQASGSRGVDVM